MDCVVGWCSTGGPCYCFLNKKSSVVLISILCLLVSLADAVSAAPGCPGDLPGLPGLPGLLGLPRQLAGLRDHAAALHDVLRVFFQAANVLLITASFFETPALMQVYVWGVLGSIVLGFAAAILDVLVRARSGSRWVVANFVSEVAFLFGNFVFSVLYLCVPLVDSYRQELEEIQLGYT